MYLCLLSIPRVLINFFGPNERFLSNYVLNMFEIDMNNGKTTAYTTMTPQNYGINCMQILQFLNLSELHSQYTQIFEIFFIFEA